MRAILTPGRAPSRVDTADLGLRFSIGADGLDTTNDRPGQVTVTASATPHTKGAYTELIASTTYDVGMLWIGGMQMGTTATGVAATDSSTLMDVAIGAASSEVDIVQNIPVGYRSNDFKLELPVFIPRGSRISLRCQSVIVSKTLTNIYWGTVPYDPIKPKPPPKLVTMGANTSTSKGVTVTAPGSVDTMGAWTEIQATTAQPFSGIIVAPQGNSGTAMSSTGVLVNIGAGSAASERVIIPNIALGGSGAEFYSTFLSLTFKASLPAGTRLAAQYARDNAGNALDLALIGVPRQW